MVLNFWLAEKKNTSANVTFYHQSNGVTHSPGSKPCGTRAEMLSPSHEEPAPWCRWCSGINGAERQTELQNLTEHVFPALTVTPGHRGRELRPSSTWEGLGGGWGAWKPAGHSCRRTQVLDFYWQGDGSLNAGREAVSRRPAGTRTPPRLVFALFCVFSQQAPDQEA